MLNKFTICVLQMISAAREKFRMISDAYEKYKMASNEVSDITKKMIKSRQNVINSIMNTKNMNIQFPDLYYKLVDMFNIINNIRKKIDENDNTYTIENIDNIFNEISNFTFNYAMTINTPEFNEWYALNNLFNIANIKRDSAKNNYFIISDVNDMISKIKNYIYNIPNNQFNQLIEILPIDHRNWFIDEFDKLHKNPNEICILDSNMFSMIINKLIFTFINIDQEDLNIY
jgi:hypothetical protein